MVENIFDGYGDGYGEKNIDRRWRWRWIFFCSAVTVTVKFFSRRWRWRWRWIFFSPPVTVAVTVTKNQDFTVTVTAHGDVSPSCPDKKSKEFLWETFMDFNCGRGVTGFRLKLESSLTLKIARLISFILKNKIHSKKIKIFVFVDFLWNWKDFEIFVH